MKPSASGTATYVPGSSSPTPVATTGATNSPLRTAAPTVGSRMAAVRVASTWSATAPLTRTPCPEARPRAWRASAAVNWRRCRVSARSSSPSRPDCASRNAAPMLITWSTCSASRRATRLTTQAAVDGLRNALTRAARSRSSSRTWRASASRACVNSGSGSA
ncbi:hypothetical protein [Nocardioides sp. AE5]|uniref:hypothetical protein n=1 Tax=Nocardioides sp. AE5 TaxID=2962573 RepID=UPI002880DB36|nr:hypothetical protein [Nocardioides sp. AE5]MDT0201220.1 hypothetical protein [Nocardioides sp. AE5]